MRSASGRGPLRLASHLIILFAVIGLVGFSAFGPSSPSRSGMALAGPVVAAAEQPALPAPADQQPAVAAPAPTAAVAPVGSTPIEPTLGPTAIPWPAAGVPNWLRALTSTTLWDGPDANAAPKSTFAANGYLKTLGPAAGSRLQVYSTGDGGSTGPAWVEKEAVQPSDMPPWLGGPTPPGVTANLATPPARSSDADPAPTVTATHVAIVDDASGKLLYGLDEHAQVPEASVTKIATTIVALERQPDLTQTYTTTVSATEMANRDGSSVMGLEPGEQVTLATLLNGMMLPSGNDAAEQVALSIGGDRQTYVG
ncbi:MAG: serine hydrolase, partial [Chloroflexi bacterium]|nr:serine hydrolase [Chloroflexota bacterium]